MMAMHMYVWKLPSFIATAQAANVQQARELALAEIGSEDGSCSERVKAIAHVQEVGPTIYYRGNAEFALTDSGALEEVEECVRRLRSLLESRGVSWADIRDAECRPVAVQSRP